MLPIRNVMIIPIKANKAERPKAMPWVAPPVRPNIPSTKGPVPVVPSGSVEKPRLERSWLHRVRLGLEGLIRNMRRSVE